MMHPMNYDERLAFATVRKVIKRNPELAAQLMEGMSKEVAVTVLLQAQRELKLLHQIAQAFTGAAAVLAKAEKDAKGAPPT